MSIIYNNQTIAGKYKEQIINESDTLNAGIIKIATQKEVDLGENNTTAVTPLYLSKKQDKLIAGDGILIDENLIECTVYPDEQTIVQNDDGTINCVGQLTKSNTIKLDWEGTTAEYTEAMLNGTIQPDWYCYITDDESIVDYGDVVNQSLSNLKPEGEERLAVSKMYSTTDIYTDEKGCSQLLEMKRSSFDKSKFTVVGNPTITSDGVASGFSTTSYIEIPNTNLQNAGTWEVEGIVQAFSQGVADDKAWLSPTSGNGIILPVACEYGNTNIQYQLYLSSTNTSWDIASDNSLEFPSGSIVKCNLKFTGTQYIYTCTNLDTGEVKQVVKNSTLKIYQSPTRLGCKRNTSPLKTNESIYLSQFSITVDGKKVFNGNKTGLDVIKEDNYTVVGSPTITSDGVASGFSSGNYVKIAQSLNFNNSWEITQKIKLENIATSSNVFLNCVGTSTQLEMFVVKNNDLACSIQVNGSYIATSSSGKVRLTVGLDYICKLQFTGSSYIFSYSENGIDFTKVWEISSTVKANIDTFNIGYYFTIGSIDLNAFKIYVDEQLVYQPCLKIPYNVSKTGSKIVPAYARDRVIDLYEQEGHAGYYTIDEENKNFTLPMGEIYGMIENKADKATTLQGYGITDGLNTSQITNCLLEVPQNIKLELTDGVLTLKAGSKVIVPNGFEADGVTPKFDYGTVNSDVSVTTLSTSTDSCCLFYRGDGFGAWVLADVYSGAEAPTSGAVWYDTTTNLIKKYNSSVWETTNMGLPIAIITRTNGVPVLIDQVFNGLGYIGSTIWVDKGVKGLIPNGGNEDGTLRNIEYTTDKIQVLTFGDITTSTQTSLLIDETGGLLVRICSYNENENKIEYLNPYQYQSCQCGSLMTQNGVITSFTPKLPFRAVDYSDFNKSINTLNKSINTLNKSYITGTYVSGTSWYRVWSDGWIEQGGLAVTHESDKRYTTVTFLKAFSNTNYTVVCSGLQAAMSNSDYGHVYSRTASSVRFNSAQSDADIFWYACGY